MDRAGFVGIVAANIFISVLLRNTLNYSVPDSFDIGRMLLGNFDLWGIAATSYRGGINRRPDLGQCRSEIPALDRCVCNPGAACRGHGADLDAVRQGAGT